MPQKKLFIFGMGYTSAHITSLALAQGFQVCGTVRDNARAEQLSATSPITGYAYDGRMTDDTMADDILSATHIISSVPPSSYDVVLSTLSPLLNSPESHRTGKKWLGYLSSTAVYGNHAGNTVTEDTPITPETLSIKAKWRYTAEQNWQDLATTTGHDLAIFRIAGIYGKGRNLLDKAQNGTIQRIHKPDQIFNRIHVADLAGAITHAMTATANNTGIFNVADHKPCPAHFVSEFACGLMGVTPPPLIPFEQAELSTGAKQFWQDSKTICNTRLTEHLGYTLTHPTYRHGLQALFRELYGG